MFREVLQENMHKGIHILKCVRVHSVGEELLDFDKSFRQRVLGRRVMEAGHRWIVKSLSEGSDRTTAAIINCTPHSASYIQVLSSGMSNSSLYRLKREEFIEVLEASETQLVVAVEWMSLVVAAKIQW